MPRADLPLSMLTRYVSSSTQKNPDDVVITLAIRTPLTKGFKGGFKDTPLDYIVYSLLKKVIEKSNIDPQMVEDICIGNVRLNLLMICRGLLEAKYLLRSAIREQPTSSVPHRLPQAFPTPPVAPPSTASALRD